MTEDVPVDFLSFIEPAMTGDHSAYCADVRQHAYRGAAACTDDTPAAADIRGWGAAIVCMSAALAALMHTSVPLPCAAHAAKSAGSRRAARAVTHTPTARSRSTSTRTSTKGKEADGGRQGAAAAAWAADGSADVLLG